MNYLSQVAKPLDKFLSIRTYDLKEPKSYLVLIPILSTLMYETHAKPLRETPTDKYQKNQFEKMKQIKLWHVAGALARLVASIALAILLSPFFLIFTLEASLNLSFIALADTHNVEYYSSNSNSSPPQTPTMLME